MHAHSTHFVRAGLGQRPRHVVHVHDQLRHALLLPVKHDGGTGVESDGSWINSCTLRPRRDPLVILIAFGPFAYLAQAACRPPSWALSPCQLSLILAAALLHARTRAGVLAVNSGSHVGTVGAQAEELNVCSGRAG